MRSSKVQNWRELYSAALLETNRERLFSRIAEAEQALLLRDRELLNMSGEVGQEAKVVDDALYVLRALRHCWESQRAKMR